MLLWLLQREGVSGLEWHQFSLPILNAAELVLFIYFIYVSIFVYLQPFNLSLQYGTWLPETLRMHVDLPIYYCPILYFKTPTT